MFIQTDVSFQIRRRRLIHNNLNKKEGKEVATLYRLLKIEVIGTKLHFLYNDYFISIHCSVFGEYFHFY